MEGDDDNRKDDVGVSKGVRSDGDAGISMLMVLASRLQTGQKDLL